MTAYNIDAAMQCGELTEEEAYFILRFAGHIGYHKAIQRLKGRWLHQLRGWIIWCGGWESPELLQWDEGWPRWKFRTSYGQYWTDPWPLSLFGHRITFYGQWMDWRWRRGYYVLNFRHKYLYWSPNGTTHHVRTRFIFGKYSD